MSAVPDELPTAATPLDALRNRVHALSQAINALQRDLNATPPTQLPPWEAIQRQHHILMSQLVSLLETLFKHGYNQDSFLARAHAYPESNFPGISQTGLMQQLMRKKLEPSVEDWMERGTQAAGKAQMQAQAQAQAQAEGGPVTTVKEEDVKVPQSAVSDDIMAGLEAAIGPSPTVGGGKDTAMSGTGVANEKRMELAPLSTEDLAELWAWAGEAANHIARAVYAGKTVNVATGDVEGEGEDEDEGEEEDDDEEGDDDAMDGTAATAKSKDVQGLENKIEEDPQMMDLNEILKFTSTGVRA